MRNSQSDYEREMVGVEGVGGVEKGRCSALDADDSCRVAAAAAAAAAATLRVVPAARNEQPSQSEVVLSES